MRREGSPMKVKQYFTHPLHRIQQHSFLQVGYTPSHLNTLVRTFTNRHNGKCISFTAIRSFITSFTNNTKTLIDMYEQFFIKNFKVTQYGDILLQEFIQFFTKNQGYILQDLKKSQLKKIHNQMQPMTATRINEMCQQLGINMSLKQAQRLIKILNRDNNQNGQHLTQQAFIKAIIEKQKI